MHTDSYYGSRRSYYPESQLAYKTVNKPQLTASEIELAKKIINEMALMVVNNDGEAHEKMFSKYGSFGMELVEKYIKAN